MLCHNNAPAVLTFGADGLKCQADSQDVGSAAEVLSDLHHAGDPFTIGLNPGFLAHALAQYGDSAVEIRLQNPLRPVLLTDATGALSQILMPIRLNVG